MYWEWLSSCEWSSSVDGSSAGEVDARVASREGVSFKDVLLAAYDTLCKVLPDCAGLAYKKVCFCASSAGLSPAEADAFAALYFSLNYEMSPLETDLEKGKEFIPLASLLDDAVAWFRTHKGQAPRAAIRLYAEYSLRETESQPSEPATPDNGIISLGKVNIKTRIRDILYPLDKINSGIWSLLEEGTKEQLPLRAEKLGSKQPIDILYSIDFDALEASGRAKITKKLTKYDKRVYIAAAGLFNAGNTVITLRQIYDAMGGMGRANAAQRKKISESIHKMIGAHISIDNSMEVEAGYNYDKFQYGGPLLPAETISQIVNGNLVDEAIHLFREPPAMTFARQRGQIATIPIKVLNSPANKTDENLAIEDYLIERISRAKKGKGLRRILYKTIAENARITSAKQQQRLPEKVKTYLDYYVSCSFIGGYTAAKDGVSISFAKEDDGQQ